MTRADHFLSRWSRLKRETAATPAPVAAALRPAVDVANLPDPATLGIDADFTAFLYEEVEEGVRRAALKKLFHLPEFNVMDGLDVYIDDYSLPDPLDPGMLERLRHARDFLIAEPAPEVAPEVAPAIAPVATAAADTAPLSEAEQHG